MGKEFSVLIAGRAVQALLSIVALRVMTTFLSPAEAGNYFLMLSFATGFSFFLINPVGMYINRRLHAWHGGKTLLDRLSVFNAYLLAVSAFALAATALLKALIGSAPGMPGWAFASFVAAYVYCSSWNMTLIPSLNMLGHRLPFVALTVLTTGLGLLLSLFAVRQVQPFAFSWMAGQIIAMLLAAGAALYALKLITGEKYSGLRAAIGCADRASFSGVKAFALPLAGATVFMWLQTQGYRLIVEARAGAEFLGYLAVGLGIAASLAAISESLVQQLYYPSFYKKITSDSPDARRAALAALAEKALPVYVILLFFTISLAPQLTGLLVHKKFGGAAPFIVFGAFIEFFRMTANIMAAAAHSEMRTKLLIRPYAYGGLALCAAAYAAAGSAHKDLLIPLSMAGGGLVTLLLMWRQVSRVVDVDLNFGLLLKTSAFAAPLLIFLALKSYTGTMVSLWILLSAGLYFLWLQYLAAFRWTDKPELPGLAPAQVNENAKGASYD